MKKALKITAAAVAAIVFVAGAAVAVLTTYNWNRAKPWINEKVTEATERSFEISGDLSLDWRAPVQKQQGLFGWLPWPHLRAYDIRLGNPEWSTTGPYMARIRQMDFPIDIWPLLHKTIRLPSVLLTEPDLILERDKGTKNNWVFPKRDARDSKWQLDIQSLGITHGTVRYVDPQKKADVMTHLDTLADGSVKWSANGRFNVEKLSGEGQAGALLSLQSANVKYPVKASLKVGETTITADGTLTNPAHFSALDVNLKILGASMSDLFPISGIVLPSTPKFSTEGHLSGTIVPQDIRLHYEKFKGQVGTSDLEGSLEYMQKQSGIPRALLRGKVASNRLNFSDLAPVIGAGSAPEKRKKKEDAKLLPGRVLPVEPFKTDRWSAMDIQV